MQDTEEDQENNIYLPMGRKQDTSQVRVIANFASANKWYREGQERLKESLKRFDPYSHHVFFKESWEIKGEPHKTNPYGFKPEALAMLRGEGATQVMWLDASMYAVNSLTPLWDRLEKETHIFQANGDWTLERWCNKSCREIMSLEGDLSHIKLFSAGMTCLNLETDKANEFLDRWLHYSRAGAFKGSWRDHRHDMSVGSWLAHELGMELSPDYTIFCYIGKVYQDSNGPPPEDAIFYLKSI